MSHVTMYTAATTNLKMGGVGEKMENGQMDFSDNDDDNDQDDNEGGWGG